MVARGEADRTIALQAVEGDGKGTQLIVFELRPLVLSQKFVVSMSLTHSATAGDAGQHPVHPAARTRSLTVTAWRVTTIRLRSPNAVKGTVPMEYSDA